MKLVAKTLTVLNSLTIALSLNYAAFALDPETLYQRSSPAVVVLAAPNGKAVALGSGVIMNSQGIIVTSNHVVANSQQVAVKLADGSIYQGVVVSRSPENDLAVIRIRPKKQLPSLRVQSVLPRVGQRVYAIGNPAPARILDRSLSDGIVSRIDEKGLIQHTAAVSPGSSGGPLLDENGNVVGIVRGGFPGTSLNFAVPGVLVFNLSSNGRTVDRRQQEFRNTVQAGIIEARRGNYQEALAIYNKAIQQNSNSLFLYSLYTNRGSVRYLLKDYQGAIEDYSRSIQLKPNSLAYYSRAWSRSLSKQYQPAIADFTRAIQVNWNWSSVNPGEAIYGRGQAQNLQGNTKAAISDFQQAANYFSRIGNLERYRAALDQITLLRGR